MKPSSWEDYSSSGHNTLSALHWLPRPFTSLEVKLWIVTMCETAIKHLHPNPSPAMSRCFSCLLLCSKAGSTAHSPSIYFIDLAAYTILVDASQLEIQISIALHAARHETEAGAVKERTLNFSFRIANALSQGKFQLLHSCWFTLQNQSAAAWILKLHRPIWV